MLPAESRTRLGRSAGLRPGARGLVPGTNGDRLPDEPTRTRKPARELEREELDCEEDEDILRCRCSRRGSTPGTFAA
jgi:hypothetical protein